MLPFSGIDSPGGGEVGSRSWGPEPGQTKRVGEEEVSSEIFRRWWRNWDLDVGDEAEGEGCAWVSDVRMGVNTNGSLYVVVSPNVPQQIASKGSPGTSS